jgi:hypothetical protein
MLAWTVCLPVIIYLILSPTAIYSSGYNRLMFLTPSIVFLSVFVINGFLLMPVFRKKKFIYAVSLSWLVIVAFLLVNIGSIDFIFYPSVMLNRLTGIIFSVVISMSYRRIADEARFANRIQGN